MQVETTRPFYPTQLPATDTDPKSCHEHPEDVQEKELEKEGADDSFQTQKAFDFSLNFAGFLKQQNKDLRSSRSIIPEDHLREQNFRKNQHSKELIITVAEMCPTKGVVLILGAGDCSNLPLVQLTKLFRKVILVDLDNESLENAKNQLNEELQEKISIKIQDLSGAQKFLETLKKCVSFEEFKATLNTFLETPTFVGHDLANERADLVISSEVLNNLGSSIKNYISYLNETYFGSFTDFLKLLFLSQPWERFVLELTGFHLKQLDSCLKIDSIAYITFCESMVNSPNGYYSTKQTASLVPKPILFQIENTYKNNSPLARKKWIRQIANPESKLEAIFYSPRNATTIFSPREKVPQTRSASEPLMRSHRFKLEGIMEGEVKKKFLTPIRSKQEEASKLQMEENFTAKARESSDSDEPLNTGMKVPPIKFSNKFNAKKNEAYDSESSDTDEEDESEEQIIYSPRQVENEERGYIRQPKNIENMQTWAWAKKAPLGSSKGSRLKRSMSIINKQQQKNPHSEE